MWETFVIEHGEDGGKVAYIECVMRARGDGDPAAGGAGAPNPYVYFGTQVPARVPVAGNEGRLHEAMLAAFEGGSVYQEDVSAADFGDTRLRMTSYPMLSPDDVDERTECGTYCCP